MTLQHSWHRAPRWRSSRCWFSLSAVSDNPISNESPYTLFSPLLASPLRPLLGSRLHMGLKCHSCHPLQVVRPAKPPPATAEPTPKSAPVTASLWSPASSQAQGGATHKRTLIQASAASAASCRSLRPTLLFPASWACSSVNHRPSSFISWLQLGSADKGVGEAVRLGEGEGTYCFFAATCSGLCPCSIISLLRAAAVELTSRLPFGFRGLLLQVSKL